MKIIRKIDDITEGEILALIDETSKYDDPTYMPNSTKQQLIHYRSMFVKEIAMEMYQSGEWQKEKYFHVFYTKIMQRLRAYPQFQYPVLTTLNIQAREMIKEYELMDQYQQLLKYNDAGIIPTEFDQATLALDGAAYMLFKEENLIVEYTERYNSDNYVADENGVVWLIDDLIWGYLISSQGELRFRPGIIIKVQRAKNEAIALGIDISEFAKHEYIVDEFHAIIRAIRGAKRQLNNKKE